MVPVFLHDEFFQFPVIFFLRFAFDEFFITRDHTSSSSVFHYIIRKRKGKRLIRLIDFSHVKRKVVGIVNDVEERLVQLNLHRFAFNRRADGPATTF